jgi:hypothetical protein
MTILKIPIAPSKTSIGRARPFFSSLAILVRTLPHTFLAQELVQIVRGDELGKRQVDRLVEMATLTDASHRLVIVQKPSPRFYLTVNSLHSHGDSQAIHRKIHRTSGLCDASYRNPVM